MKIIKTTRPCVKCGIPMDISRHGQGNKKYCNRCVNIAYEENISRSYIRYQLRTASDCGLPIKGKLDRHSIERKYIILVLNKLIRKCSTSKKANSIKALRRKGHTYAQIGEELGVSRQYAQQMCNNHMPEIDKIQIRNNL